MLRLRCHSNDVAILHRRVTTSSSSRSRRCTVGVIRCSNLQRRQRTTTNRRRLEILSTQEVIPTPHYHPSPPVQNHIIPYYQQQSFFSSTAQRQHDDEEKEEIILSTSSSSPSSNIQESKQQQQQQQQQPKTNIISRHSLVNNIHHWLSKDPNFFNVSLEALDINSEMMSNRNVKDPNNNHPFHLVWKQYQQLYVDTIPIFCSQLKILLKEDENDDVDEDKTPTTETNRSQKQQIIMSEDDAMMKDVISKLENVGFNDVQWAKRFRRYRGYKMHKDEKTSHLMKLQQSLKQHGTKLHEEQDKLMELYRKQKIEQDRLENKQKIQQQQMAIEQDIEQQKEKSAGGGDGGGSSSSVFSSIFSEIKSLFSLSGLDNDINNKRKEEKELVDDKTKSRGKRRRGRGKRRSSHGSQEDNYDPQLVFSSGGKDTVLSRHSLRHIENQIRKKKDILYQLQTEFQDIRKKVDTVQNQIDDVVEPMPHDEYQRAMETVLEVTPVICQEMANQIQHRHAELIDQYRDIDTKTDLTKPHEWYPYARLDQRKIIFHGGPTNSGKTYSALQRLREAENGLYLGPLRLLAAEIYEELTADGLYTKLYTGQEKRDVAFSTHISATVEMSNPNIEYDVVVIDEIQMIADETRGAAWTKALLSLRCKEIHVCGGLEAIELVKNIANICGDEFELNTYERFSPLQIADRAISKNPTKPGCYKNVKPGDCVVAFTRNDIFAIKREIEKTTKYKCCVVYGRLPPTIRTDQARRFNDPNSGYDILVASDAIGMGLNLNIKRIIFNTIFKFNGEEVIRLSHSEIKQISGRAGRRNSPYPNGEVTCRDPRDLPYIQQCMSAEIPPIAQAALLPTAEHIEFFSHAMYNTYGGLKEEKGKKQQHDTIDLYQILTQFNAMATVKGNYFLGRQREMRAIAKRLKNIPLSIRDSYDLCLTPTSDDSLEVLENFALKLSRGEVCGLSSRSVPKKAKTFDDLSYLCNIYADSDIFLWLQNKFPPANAVEQQAAVSRKERTMLFINEALSQTDRLRLNHCYARSAARKRTEWEAENGPSSTLPPLDEEATSEFDDMYKTFDDEEDELLFEDDKEEAAL